MRAIVYTVHTNTPEISGEVVVGESVLWLGHVLTITHLAPADPLTGARALAIAKGERDGNLIVVCAHVIADL
jgi:hypothetical protein